MAICLLSILVLTGICSSGGWQKHTVTVQPKAIFNVYRSIVTLVPDDHGKFPPQPVGSAKWQSEMPEPLFAIWGGLFAVHVPSICDPLGETFDQLVDRALCKVKLAAFCNSRKDSTMATDFETVADMYHDTCLSLAGGQGGVAIPLLIGPVVEEAKRMSDFVPSPVQLGDPGDTQEQLAQELGTLSTDTRPNFCESVADCALLEDLRPWTGSIFVLLCLVMFVLVFSCLLHGCAIARRSKSMSLVGWHTYLAATMLALSLVILYIVSSEKIPADTLVKKEDLFYFMLPGTFEPPENKEEKVQADGASGSALVQLGEQPARPRSWGAARGGPWRAGWRRGEQVDGRGGDRLVRQSPSEARRLVSAPGPRLVAGASSYLALRQRQRTVFWDRRRAAQPQQAPRAGEATRAGEAEATRASGGAPAIAAAKWNTALMAVFKEALEAWKTKNWDGFFEKLKIALSDAFRLSQMIFKRWVYYVEKNLERGPQDGNALLGSLIDGVLEMKKVEEACAKAGAECNMTEHSALHAEAAAELEEVHSLSQVHSKSVLGLIKTAKAVIVGVVEIWNTVNEPIYRMIERIKKFLSKVLDQRMEASLSSSGQTLVDDYFIDDLQALFMVLFSQLPMVMANVRMIGRQWMAVIKNMDTYLARLARAMRIVHRLVVELLKSAASDSLAASQQLLMDLRIDTFTQAAGFWTNVLQDTSGGADSHLFLLRRELELASAGDISVGVSTAAPAAMASAESAAASASSFAFLNTTSSSEAAEGSGMAMSLMERLQSGSLVRAFNAQGGLAMHIAPFISGGLSNPSARLGSIFLEELSSMGTKTGFKTRAELGHCSLTSPSACTQYAHSFWLYWVALVLMLGTYVYFTLDFWWKPAAS